MDVKKKIEALMESVEYYGPESVAEALYSFWIVEETDEMIKKICDSVNIKLTDDDIDEDDDDIEFIEGDDD